MHGETLKNLEKAFEFIEIFKFKATVQAVSVLLQSDHTTSNLLSSLALAKNFIPFALL